MTAFRYLFGMLWPRVTFVVFAGCILFMVLDGMEAARWLAKGTALQVVSYYALWLPELCQQLMGAGVVLGVLSGIGQLHRKAEMTALAAAGRSLKSGALPAVMATCLLAAAGHAALAQWVVPRTSPRFLDLRAHTFDMTDTRYWAFYYRAEWLQAGPFFARSNRVVWNGYDDTTGLLVSAEHGVEAVVRAQQVRATGHDTVSLSGAAVTRLYPAISYQEGPTLELPMPNAAAALSAPSNFPEHYPLGQLINAIDHRSRGGRDTTAYRVALVRRFVDPMMVWLLGLAALPLSVRMRRDAPVERMLLVGAGAVGLAHVLTLGSDVLTRLSALPLWLGAVLPPGLAAVLCLLAWYRADRPRSAR